MLQSIDSLKLVLERTVNATMPAHVIPLEPHRAVVATLLDEAVGNPAVIGALLIGSLGHPGRVPLSGCRRRAGVG